MSGAFDEFARTLATRCRGGAHAPARRCHRGGDRARPTASVGAGCVGGVAAFGSIRGKACLKGVFCGFAVKNGYNMAAVTTRRSPSSIATTTRRRAPGAPRKASRAATKSARGRGTATARPLSIRRPAPELPPNKVCGKRCCDEDERATRVKCSVRRREPVRDGLLPSRKRLPKQGAKPVLRQELEALRPGRRGRRQCGPPSDFSCFNKKTKAVTCCDSKHVCDEGVCGCAKGTKNAEGCCKGRSARRKSARRRQVQLRRRTLLRRQETLLRQDLLRQQAGKCIGGSCCPPNRLGKGASASAVRLKPL